MTVSLPLRDFTENILRDVRNEFVNDPTSGNAKIDRFKAIWNWVKEFSTAVKLPDVCPTTKITRLETLNEAHPIWPHEVISKFIADRNRLVTLYYLARYTGQRLGDCCNMQRSDFDDEGKRIFVVQEKTGAKIWIPIHKILAEHLRTLPGNLKNNDFLTTNTRGDQWQAPTVTEALGEIMKRLKTPGYTMHGLRHLAGVDLAYAGCSPQEIAAVLGHKDTRQSERYCEQAKQIKLAETAMEKREAYDDRQQITNNVQRVTEKRKRVA
jgi:integrase